MTAFNRTPQLSDATRLPTCDSRVIPVRSLRTYGPRRIEQARNFESCANNSFEIFEGEKSEAARTLRSEIDRVARRPYNILIPGETGTGKTHTARAIHRRSTRSDKPFLELNCANLPEQLVEAELFGYARGAFTGADHTHRGIFEGANSGMLFLDEIGDIPLTVQNRLLKAIEEKQFKRLGTNHYISCDIQIIAATSRNLNGMLAEGSFREDLYCRLAVLTVRTVPLRERREDIPAMISMFLGEASAAIMGSNKCMSYSIEDNALVLLCQLDYPGNIRALRNLIYELTSYVEPGDPISIELVRSVLSKVPFAGNSAICANGSVSELGKRTLCDPQRNLEPAELVSWLRSLAGEGDILLPRELCVLRRGETFNQWSARAKRGSIEAARQATGGMRAAADRLGLTRDSLKNHLRRAKEAQNETLFD